MKTITTLVLAFLVSFSLNAQKKYNLDSFTSLLGTSSDRELNKELDNIKNEFHALFIPNSGTSYGFHTYFKEGIVNSISIEYGKDTKYMTQYIDFYGLNANPSKKDAYKFIKSLGNKFKIIEDKEGPNGSIILEYKDIYTIEFAVYKKKVYKINFRLNNDKLSYYKDIEFKKHGPLAIELGAKGASFKWFIHIIVEKEFGININFNDTILNTAIGVDRFYKGSYKLGKSAGTYTFPMEEGTVTYEGEFENLIAHGKGTLTLSNGDVIIGEWAKGLPVKMERLPYKGCIYKGPVFINMTAEKGKLTCGDTIITGDFKPKNFGRRSWKYKITAKDYSYYGEIGQDLKPDGRGSLTSKEFRIKNGTFNNGVPWSGTAYLQPSPTRKNNLKGAFRKGMFIRDGFINMENSVEYSGTYDINDLPHGKGKYKYPNGDFINFESNHGTILKITDGKLTQKDGSVLKGNFNVKKQLHGGGSITYPNKDMISGQFENGVFKGGLGSFRFKTNEYSGAIDANKIPNGKGKLIFKNGSIHEGNFINGVFQGGFGKLVSNEGTYEGEFTKTLTPHGKGVMVDKKGNKVSGVFENGIFKGGIGSAIYADGSKIVAKTDANGMAQGDGTITQSNGSTYKGRFINNVFQGGTGKIHYSSDGSIYEGSVNANFKPHGKGKNYKGSSSFSATEYVKGTFNNGALVPGEAKRKYSNGWYYEGIVDSEGNPNGKGRLSTYEIFELEYSSYDAIIVTGTFNNGQIIGNAFITNKKQKYLYEGPVNSNFLPHGYGKIKFNGGEWQSASFTNGKRN